MIALNAPKIDGDQALEFEIGLLAAKMPEQDVLSRDCRIGLEFETPMAVFVLTSEQSFRGARDVAFQRIRRRRVLNMVEGDIHREKLMTRRLDAFAPEAGESVQSELASAPPPPPDFTIAVPIPGSSNDADLYVNSKYFGAVFASAEPADVAARLAVTQRPFAARCLTDKTPEAVGWKTIPSWYVIGDADNVIPPDIQLKFATRAKSKVYHVPGGDHPSMIAHPEVAADAIRDAANAVSR